jgi:hypothetical protein
MSDANLQENKEEALVCTREWYTPEPLTESIELFSGAVT